MAEEKNKIKILVVVSLLAIIGLLAAIRVANLEYERDLNAKSKTEHDLEERNRQLEQRLRTSEEQRVVLGLRVDSINNRVQTLVRANKQLDSTLATVKGKYNRQTPSELATEMVRRYDANR